MFKPAENDFQNVCTMVGLMTITWAWAENALALSIGIIDGAVGEMRWHREIPVSLKNRLAYLKIALRDVEALHPVEDTRRALIKGFNDLKMRRGELVHGSAWQLEKCGFESLGFTIKGRDHAAKEKRFEIADTIRLNVEITKLADDAAALLLRVGEIFRES